MLDDATAGEWEGPPFLVCKYTCEWDCRSTDYSNTRSALKTVGQILCSCIKPIVFSLCLPFILLL